MFTSKRSNLPINLLGNLIYNEFLLKRQIHTERNKKLFKDTVVGWYYQALQLKKKIARQPVVNQLTFSSKGPK